MANSSEKLFFGSSNKARPFTDVTNTISQNYPDVPFTSINVDGDARAKVLHHNQYPVLQAFLIPHIFENVMKYLPFHYLKQCRQVCKDWNYSVTASLQNNQSCKVVVDSKEKYIDLFDCFNETSMIPSNYVLNWNINCKEHFDECIHRFGSAMKTLIISDHHSSDEEAPMPIQYFMKLLTSDSVQLEVLNIKYQLKVNRTETSIVDLVANNPIVYVSEDFQNFSLHFPNNSTLKSLKLGPYFLNGALGDYRSTSYPLFYIDFFRSTIALESLDISSYDTNLIEQETQLLVGVLLSGVLKTVKFLKVGVAHSDVLHAISTSGAQLKGFEAYATEEVSQTDSWYQFLTGQAGLESLKVACIQTAPTPSILKLPEMKALKSLTVLIPLCPLLHYESSLSRTCPVLTTLSLCSVPFHLLLPGKIHGKITSLNLENLVTEPEIVTIITKHFPALKKLKISISEISYMTQLWTNFPNLETLDLTLSLVLKCTNNDEVPRWIEAKSVGALVYKHFCGPDELDQIYSDAFEVRLNGRHNDTFKKDTTPSIFNLQQLRVLRIRIESTQMWIHPVNRCLRINIGDTAWYEALTTLRSLKEVELYNFVLSKECRKKIIMDSGIRKITAIVSAIN